MTRTDDLLEPHEAELRDLLVRSMSGTTSPSDIAPHALRHGRRLRTRRRLGIAVGAVAAGAAALIVPVVLGGGSTPAIDPAGEPSSSATAPTQESPDSPLLDGWWSMPATDMVSTVEAILPDGVVVTDPGPLQADTAEGGPGAGLINAVVTSDAGPGRLNVILYPTIAPPTESSVQIDGGGSIEVDVAPYEEGDISCPGDLAPRAQCAELRAGDGTLVGRRSTTTFGDVTTLEVVLRRNGGIVYAAAANTLAEKWGRTSPASAEVPPLDLDQLEDLVRNDTWVMPAT